MAREQYYYEGETGGEVSGPFHTDRECPELGESVRPIHAELVDLDKREVCSECVPLQSDSESGGENLVGSFDPSEHTVSEVEEHVQSIDGDSIEEELRAIRAAEVEGKNRVTALEAIDEQLD